MTCCVSENQMYLGVLVLSGNILRWEAWVCIGNTCWLELLAASIRVYFHIASWASTQHGGSFKEGTKEESEASSSLEVLTQMSQHITSGAFCWTGPDQIQGEGKLGFTSGRGNDTCV